MPLFFVKRYTSLPSHQERVKYMNDRRKVTKLHVLLERAIKMVPIGADNHLFIAPDSVKPCIGSWAARAMVMVVSVVTVGATG